MPATLSDALRGNLRASLVGREDERALFSAALAAETLPFHVVHVSGPGGVGKTTLLREFERLAQAAGAPTALLDLRDVAATPDGFALAVRAAFAGAPGGARRVLLLDTFEAAQDLDGWLQRVFLPGQPADQLVVVAGRHPPGPAWTADAVWADAVRTLPLGNLSDAEAEAFCTVRGVPAAEQAGVLAFTHGYPLALALVAERLRQRPGQPFVPSEAPDVVRALLDRFVRDLPSPEHRTAIEGAALVRAVTAPLLAALLEDAGGDGSPDATALFGWLRDLTFVDDGPRGLVLHDVAREAIEADLRWRDGERYAELHGRARRFYTSRLLAEGHETALVLGDYVHLYRDNPVVAPLLGPLVGAWRGAEVRPARPLHPADVPALVAMTRRHEGDDAADVAAHWFAAQPHATEVFDAADGTPAGFLTALALDETEAADRAPDPLARAAWAAAERTRRPGERVLLFRFWMDAEAHQGLSAVQSIIFARTVHLYLTVPRLAVSLLPVAEPELWGPVFAFVGLARWPEAEPDGGPAGRPPAVFGMDWRAVPPAAWLDALAARVPMEVPAPPERAAPDARVVLAREAFDEAVREALRTMPRAHLMADNPLLRAALVEEATGADATPAERAGALVGHLTRAAETLRAAPRDVPLWNALRLTYLTPAPSQAIAAERLDVPFSSYRRHLVRGIAHVADTLWREETGG